MNVASWGSVLSWKTTGHLGVLGSFAPKDFGLPRWGRERTLCRREGWWILPMPLRPLPSNGGKNRSLHGRTMGEPETSDTRETESLGHLSQVALHPLQPNESHTLNRHSPLPDFILPLSDLRPWVSSSNSVCGSQLLLAGEASFQFHIRWSCVSSLKSVVWNQTWWECLYTVETQMVQIRRPPPSPQPRDGC